MKIFIPLILISLTALSWSNQTDPPHQENTSLQQVIAVHQVELKEDVDSNEFEQFVNTEIAPIYNKVEGLQFMLAKGDRGSRIDKYAIILTFATLEDRNRIFPDGEKSPVDWGDSKIWEKFTSMMASGIGDVSTFTDYVEIPN